MQIQHPNEIELIRQTLAGDTSAFDQLVKAHRRTIYVLALSYIKNPADAEDLTQRIFIQAYERLVTLRQLDHFLPWLQQIAHNACKDWLRHQSDLTTDFETVNDEDFTETAPSPEDMALKREVEAVVREAIGALQETDRKLVEGRYIEGASYNQLQVESGLSYAAIANRLKRAKRQMRRRIEKLLGGMVILPGRTFIWGGIETVKFSVKTKLAAVGVAAVLGIGGGVWYHHTLESNPVVVNKQGGSEPVTEVSTQTEQASAPNSITAEEGEELDAAIALLKALDETVEGQAEPSEAQSGMVEQPPNGDTQNGDEVDAEEAYYAQFDEEMNQTYGVPLEMIGIPRFNENATAMYFKPTDADQQRLRELEAEVEDAVSKHLLAQEEREGFFSYPLDDDETVYVHPDFLERYDELVEERKTIHERSMVEGPTTAWNTMPYKKRRLPDGTALIYYRRRNGDLVRSVEKPDGTVRKWVIGWTDLTPYEEYASHTWRDD